MVYGRAFFSLLPFLNSKDGSSSASLTNLPPEVFGEIAAHVPLYTRNRILLSLALTSKEVCHLALPLLYRDLVLGDNRSIWVAARELRRQPDKGTLVRRLYFRSRSGTSMHSGTGTHFKDATCLSRITHSLFGLWFSEQRNDDDNVPTNPGIFPPSTLSGLLEFLPFLQHLEWSILKDSTQCCGCDPEKIWIPPSFWTALSASCPQCHSVSLIHDESLFQRETIQNLVEHQGMDTLRLTSNWFQGYGTKDRLLSAVIYFSDSLRALDITIPNRVASYVGALPLFALVFSRLESLAIDVDVVENRNTEDAMAFWERHPKLERICLRHKLSGHPLFDEGLLSYRTRPQVFLPHLRYLRASYNEVMELLQHLPQLRSLDMTTSLGTAEVYAFMLSLGPETFPLLKGLTFWINNAFDALPARSQVPAGVTGDPRWMENIARMFPHLAELALVDKSLGLHNYVILKSSLRAFPHLQRFYYGSEDRCPCRIYGDTYRDNTMLADARSVFEACPKLTRIGVMGGKGFRAIRCKDGTVEGVALDFGAGTLVGKDGEAFLD
ncbi:hypothetical protein BKA70DRAFT_1574342 [Coprinopsis sp. MPI-PUGE-AT-0042]|nr:hypothetical protein BKA70DRAFT_1574342 [Coprinopsis sp. MPI-PUGE-AT-0042]